MSIVNETLLNGSYSYKNVSYLQLQTGIVITYLVIVMIVGTIGNMIVLHLLHATKYYQFQSDFLMVNLAVCDLLSCMVMMPLFIYSAVERRPPIYGIGCSLLAFVTFCLFGASVNTTLAITVDRALAIVWPFRYRQWNLMKKHTVVSIIWTGPMLVNAIPLLSLQKYGLGVYTYTNLSLHCGLDLQLHQENYLFQYIASISTLVLIGDILFLYALIFRVAYQKWQSRRLENHVTLFKTIRTTALIVGTNVICWIPLGIEMLLSAAGWYHYSMDRAGDRLRIAIMYLPYLNGALNPLLYITSNQIMKAAFLRRFYWIKRFLNCCRIRNRTDTIYPMTSTEDQT